MNATTIALDSADNGWSGSDATTSTEARVAPNVVMSRIGSFTSDVYRLHGFRILDPNGTEVGIVDWIWTDEESGHGEFLGVGLRWLRGTARAIPCAGARIDHARRTIHVSHSAHTIAHVRRFKIDRVLTAREKRRVCFHYELEPATLRSLEVGRQLAA